MNGIDIARYQKGIDLSVVPCDFVIVKATQGTTYISPTFKNQIEHAIKQGKKIGIYHYASGGGYANEADHFLRVAAPYIGKAILVLDWESDQNAEFKNKNHGYAVEWLRYVHNKTGIKPFIYMSKSVCRAYKWDADYPLWCAQYKNKAITGYQDSPWTDTKGFGAWVKPLIYQYSSCGRLPGYNGNLDLDKAYMADWETYCKPTEQTKPAFPLLKMGSRGDDVKLLQTLLNNKGYECAIDGIFGKQTENCVRFFQADHIDIVKYMDGICGRLTWSALTL